MEQREAVVYSECAMCGKVLNRVYKFYGWVWVCPDCDRCNECDHCREGSLCIDLENER